MMNSAWSEVSPMMKVISSDGWMMNSDSSESMGDDEGHFL